ncbi:hypothetical protein AMS68_002018 [Peltaster fructicola]|uniref:Glycosyltransferase family 8 protein n=1 Tax=Peltaster fructicola TaxID=286661 RepID=A0A6H0XPC4_9PEZI|nr:hypothetical protein AMS68_002018 [Peltaster fructicola]
MPGQRRFALYILVGVIVLLLLWRQPARIPPISSFTAHTDTKPDSKAAQEHAPSLPDKSPAQEHAPSRPDNKPAQEYAPPSPPTTLAAAVVTSTSAVLFPEPATSQARSPTSNIAQELAHTSVKHHAQTTQAPASVSGAAHPHNTQSSIALQEEGFAALQGSEDEYAYLAAPSSVDEYAYLISTASAHGSEPTKVANIGGQKQEEQEMFAYLSATTSVDEYAYLTAGDSTHTAVASHAATTSSVTTAKHITGDPNMPAEDNFDNSDYWFFQDDLNDFPLPTFDIEKLKDQAPHNYRGPGHETYATFLSTRNNSLQDPYFLATLQQAYRLLWDPKIRSKHHPFTVYVAPHIPKNQRDYLTASGAIVRQLELIEWQPTHKSKAAPRWKDMFSKLNFWNETEYSRILYLDTDAFPLENIDELFDMAEAQRCKSDELSSQERLVKEEICDYTLLAAYDKNNGGLNAGMLVIQPNPAMHKYLLRESQNADNFDQDFVEQAFLNYAFRPEGPFPYQLVDRVWNAIFTEPEDEGVIKVIHEKLWAMWFRPEHFAHTYFRDTWTAMLKLSAVGSAVGGGGGAIGGAANDIASLAQAHSKGATTDTLGLGKGTT